jgi:hypothetical protein
MKTAFIIIFLFISIAVDATTYYVKSKGNDANTGLSDAQAWATVTKLNNRGFSTGDSILFKRGDTFSYLDPLTLKYSNTFYGAYGTGAKPILTTRSSITGWDTPGNWTQAGNIWSMSYTDYQPMRLWISGVEKQRSETTVTASLPWNWTSNILYVYSATNPATAFSNIEGPGNGYTIQILETTDITLENLDIRGGGECIYVRGADNVIINNCNVGLDCGGCGLTAVAYGSINHANNGRISNCTFDSGDRFNDSSFTLEYHNTEDGIRLYFGASGWNIYNNTIKDWGHDGINLDAEVPGYLTSNNLIHNNFVTAPDIDYGRCIEAQGITGTMSGNEIYDNLFYNCPIQNQLNSYGLKFHNNIINIVRQNPIKLGYANGIAIENFGAMVGQFMEIDNNIIANCLDNGIRLAYPPSSIPIQNNFVRNNIIYNCATHISYSVYGINIEASQYDLNNTFQNNLIYLLGRTNIINYKTIHDISVSGFNALNGTDGFVITNNIMGDPLFVDAANGDFHLQAGSPAIGKGLKVTGITTDYEGTTYKNPPSIGAYEYGSTPTSAVIPVYQNSFIDTDTPSLLEMTYNVSLTNIIPSASAFTVQVNSVVRPVNSIAISGIKVLLTLASPVVNGNLVTVAYTMPSTNPLQTTSGGQAVTISAQPVVNNCINVSPTVVITSPINNSSFTALANITVTANALDTDGSISLVEFYNGSIKIGSLSSAPYSFTWNNVPAGTYSLTVIAIDNLNAKTISSAISISVNNGTTSGNQPPVITISNPQKGNKFENPATITIDAVAYDPDGTISKVEFYSGAGKLFEVTLAPYTFTWKDVKAGTYSITAIATDNLNATTTSLPIEFEVGTTIKYDANSEIINLYPNPNDGHFSIEFINPLQKERSEIVITDLAGKQVYNGPITKEELLKQFDLSNIKSGIYIMMIKDNEILVTKKIIKN